jgi:hypothetical protein
MITEVTGKDVEGSDLVLIEVLSRYLPGGTGKNNEDP